MAGPSIDPRELDPAQLAELLPVGPRDIPLWTALSWLGAVATAAYGVGLAWALHSAPLGYGYGPMIVSGLGRAFGSDWSDAARFFGSTGFVVGCNVLSLWRLRGRIAGMRLVRGPDRRTLVGRLFHSELRGLLWGLVWTGVFGLVLWYLWRGTVRGFSPMRWIVDVYEFLWGFTGKRHPEVTRVVQGTIIHRVPLVVRVGAIGLFLSVACALLRIVVNGLTLLVVRPQAAPEDLAGGQ